VAPSDASEHFGTGSWLNSASRLHKLAENGHPTRDSPARDRGFALARSVLSPGVV